jgi:CDP-glucose 4,6-dehydratase
VDKTISSGNFAPIDLSFFEGKNVFITGHTGFKGSWLSLILSDAGAKVTGYALEAEDHSNFNALNLIGKINSITGNIKDKHHLRTVIEEIQPEIIFHLAAQPLVNESYNDPIETFETNIIGSANLLDAVTRVGCVRALVFVTSDKCYENREWAWGYRESDPLGGHDPYSASKAAAELIFTSYAKSFLGPMGITFAGTARAGNVIGGGDWSKNRIIPDCVRAISQGGPVEIRNPNATRPWQHVFEPIFGYLLLAKKLYRNEISNFEAWNFGPNRTDVSKVIDVVDKFHSYFGKGKSILNIEQNSRHETNLLQLNCDKAFNFLGWTPKWDTEQAILMTAKWYQGYYSEVDMAKLSRAQIAEYVGGSND